MELCKIIFTGLVLTLSKYHCRLPCTFCLVKFSNFLAAGSECLSLFKLGASVTISYLGRSLFSRVIYVGLHVVSGECGRTLIASFRAKRWMHGRGVV